VPPPPPGSYRSPRQAPPIAAPPPEAQPAEGEVQAAGFGTLEIRIHPADAALRVDGEAWTSSEPGHFVLQVSGGRHRVEVTRTGYVAFATTIEVREGASTPLNVSLPPQP
jgi:hypothetical protein